MNELPASRSSVTDRQGPEPDTTWRGAVRLVCALAAAQLGLHIWFGISAGDPRIGMPHAVAWILDVFVLLVASTISVGLGAAMRRGGIPKSMSVFGVKVLIFFVGLLLASYPSLLTEFLAFPTNIFRTDAATTSFFVSEYLGWSGLWPLLASGAVVILASRVKWPLSLRPRTILTVCSLPARTRSQRPPRAPASRTPCSGRNQNVPLVRKDGSCRTSVRSNRKEARRADVLSTAR